MASSTGVGEKEFLWKYADTYSFQNILKSWVKVYIGKPFAGDVRTYRDNCLKILDLKEY